MPEQREVWFHQYEFWGVQRYWPIHWKGWLTTLISSILALGLSVSLTWAINYSGHPRLEWLGLFGFLVGLIPLEVLAKRHSSSRWS